MRATTESPRARFDTTSWPLVIRAAASGTPGANEALSELCSRYWYSVYAFIRRQGHPRHEAEDLAQSFFEHLLSANALRHADQNRGRFRSFLLTSLRNFLTNRREAQLARKRGGDHVHIPLDFEAAEGRFHADEATPADPEKLYTRRWALAVLEQAVRAMRAKLERDGREKQVAILLPFLTGDVDRGAYSDLAARLQTNEGALRVAVHRLRVSFRDELRRVVAQTVPDESAVDDEIRYLIAALSR